MKFTVLITGASRGIGQAIAIAFAKAGYQLVITCSKTEQDLLALAEILENHYGAEVLTSVGDIADYQYVTCLFDSIHARFGGIDVLVNNAGISYVGLLTDMSIEDWNRIINTNLTSVFSTCKHAVPYMVQKQSGKIINISSVWGNVGASMEVAYSASKGGLNTFTKALAKELAPSNIQVNAISCGLIDTDMNACFSKEDLEAVVSEIPADRIGTPEEVALMVSQILNSPSYLTGQIISFDGGWC